MSADILEIPLTQKQVALIDADDYELVMQFKWYACKRRDGFSAATNIHCENGHQRQKTLLMHRLITNAKRCQHVDHINRNPLDNRRCNLRVCSPAENARYRKTPNMPKKSAFKGVVLDSRKRKGDCRPIWRASIGFNGRRIHLGTFHSEKDAAMAYDKSAINLFGEFAQTNFPKEVYY